MRRSVFLLLAVATSFIARAGDNFVSIEDAVRAPAVHDPQLSPDGKLVASIQPIDGRGAIVLTSIDGGTRKVLHRDPKRSIGGVRWSNDGRWLLYLQDGGGDELYHLHRVDPTGRTAAVDLTPFQGAFAELIALPVRSPRRAVVGLNKRDASVLDAYRLDLDTGGLELAARNNGQMTGFFADAKGNVLLATAIRDTGELDILVRDTEASAWRTVYTAPPEERLAVLQLAQDGMSAVIKSNRGRLREELLRLQFRDGAVEPFGTHQCGIFDAGDPILDDAGDELVRGCTTEVSTLIPASPVTRRLVEAAGANLIVVSRSANAARWIVHRSAADDPGRYLLYDDETRQMRTLFVRRPWLEGRQLAVSEAHWLKARDGLPLLAYLSLPTLRTSEKPPMIVVIHGGPWTRDSAEFSGETQVWTSRGYAVLQVNFRGSTGLGRRHFEAGVGQLGLAMVDDIVDAVLWAVREKGVASDRVCVVGGSYGGYATLVALTRYPEMFACGVDYAGPVDLVTLVSSFPPDWKPFLPRSWYRFAGNPDVPAQRRAMEQQSPIHAVDRARAPLFIFQGANDPRVTRSQSDSIARAFCNKGLPVTYLVAGNEGHSFANEETALAVTRGVEVFVGRVLGGGVQKSVSPSVQRVLDQLSVKEPCAANGAR